MKAKAQRRYLKIDDTVYQSAAFRTLPGGALKLWIDLRTQFRGNNNGDLCAAMSLLAHRGWVSVSKLYRALDELLGRGLLDRTRQGRAGPCRIASLYRFTDLPCAKNEAKFIEGRLATHDYQQWKATARQKKIRAPETGAALLPKQERCRSRNGSVHFSTAPETGAQKNGEIGAKPAPTLAYVGIGVHEPERSRNRSTLYIPGDRGKNGGAVGAVDLESDPVLPERPESKPLTNEFDRARQRWERKARASAKRAGS
ncbi:MAG: hypothetical protein WKH97_03005 [Casimicrobiaceae bacterium]